MTAKEGTNEEYLRFAMVKALKAIEDKTAFVTVKHLSAKELNKIELDISCIKEQNQRADSLSKLVLHWLSYYSSVFMRLL